MHSGETTHHTGPARSALALLSVSVCLLAGCATGASDANNPAEDPAKSPVQAARAATGPRLDLHATDGQEHVPVSTGGRVTVEAGTIAEAFLSTADGRAVPGERSPDKKSWAPSADLKHGTTYRLTATATDAGGHRTTRTVAFTTLAEANSFIGNFTPGGRLDRRRRHAGLDQLRQADHRQEGRRSPRSRSPPAAARRSSATGSAPSASTSAARSTGRRTPPSPSGSGLDGVEGAAGVYGVQEQDRHASRSAAARSPPSTPTRKTMTVTRDGKTVKTIPISAGAARRTRRTTARW